MASLKQALVLPTNLQARSVYIRPNLSRWKMPVLRQNASCLLRWYSTGAKATPWSNVVLDFGEARIDPGPHAGDIMPLEYRAPEILLRARWSCPVDIWSVELPVGLFHCFVLRVIQYMSQDQCEIGMGTPSTKEALHSSR